MQTHAVNGALAIGIAQLLKLPFQAASLPGVAAPAAADRLRHLRHDRSSGFISALILNFGIGQAIIQAPGLRREQVSGLFWITIVASGVAAAIMLATSPLVAHFYNDDPRAGLVAAVSSVFLLFTGFTNIHEALLNRQMKFGWVAMISAVGMALGFVASLIAAFLGAGYWSARARLCRAASRQPYRRVARRR